MKRFFAALLLLPALAFGAANDLFIDQRNSANTGTLNRTVTVPLGADGILGYAWMPNQTTPRVPVVFTLGAGLQLNGNVLSAPGTPSGPADWSTITGKPTTVSGFGITDAVTSGVLASGLSGKLDLPSGTASQYLRGDGSAAAFPALFSGAYADLTGKPTAFTPAAHVHAAADITTGVFPLARLPALPISQVTGLQTAIDGKFPAPAGTTAQYLRGDGSLATFPTSFTPAAHTQAWSTINATPTTLAGYGVTDGVTSGALSTALAGKFNTPTGTTAQYVRGDGSLATMTVAKRIEAYSGTTNASGQVTVTYPTAFAAAPVVQPPAPALANQIWTTVSSTATGFTLQLNQRNSINLLNTDVLLGATVPVVGAAALVLVVER